MKLHYSIYVEKFYNEKENRYSILIKPLQCFMIISSCLVQVWQGSGISKLYNSANWMISLSVTSFEDTCLKKLSNISMD